MKKDRLSIIIISIIILLGLSLRLFIAWQDVMVLMVKIMPDDSFFVFRIAQEIARGHGLTFDGVIPSNSPRLIWELILSVVFLIYPQGGALPINIICTISSIADVGTVLMIFLILMKLLNNRFVALWGAGLYAFLPYAILRMNNGLETSLGIFMVMLTLYIFIKFYNDRVSGLVSYFMIGILCGVTTLTRLDYGLLLVLILIFMTFLDGIDRRYRKILMVIVGFGVLLVPWMIWSYIKFGSLIPSSGYACTYVYLDEFFNYSNHTFFNFLSRSWYFFYRALKYYAFPFMVIRMFYFGPIVFVLLIIFGIYSLFKISHDKKIAMFIALIPLMMTFFLLFLHGFIGWYAREWHCGPSYPGIILLISFILYTFTAGISKSKKKLIYVVAVIIVIPILLRIGYRDWLAEPYKFNENHYKVSVWARDNLPEDAIIGSFDGGIPGYFTERRVIDLMGIENKYAMKERKNRNLGNYLDNERINYLIMLPIRVSGRYNIAWGEDISKRLEGPMYYSDNEANQTYWERISVIYKVIPKSEISELREHKFSFPPPKPGEEIPSPYPR